VDPGPYSHEPKLFPLLPVEGAPICLVSIAGKILTMEAVDGDGHFSTV